VPQGEQGEARTVASDYKKLRPMTRVTGVRLRVKSRHGAPFVARRYRKRAGLLAGVLVFLLLPAVMSAFIWTVEVRGNEKLDSAVLLQKLEELGVRPGVYRRSLDARALERRMMLAVDELSWIAINIRGSKAEVEVKERTPPPETIDDDTKPANVVAARSGQIKRMEVYDGQPLVKPGDTVMEGGIIVSGVTEDKHGNSLIKRARALVIAWVPESITFSVPLESIVRSPVGEPVRHRYLELFSVRIPLNLVKKPGGLVDMQVETKPLGLWGVRLPASLRTELRQSLEETKQVLTEQQAKSEAMRLLARFEEESLVGKTIVEKNAAGWTENGTFFLRADYTLEMDIARLNEIILD
jgi:similar to stage IV sporulation protein